MCPKLPVILCLHGYGSSIAIFQAQTRHIRAALALEAQFVFVAGPFEAPPGPGILPYFANCGPYGSWFSAESFSADAQPEAKFMETVSTIEKMLAQQDLTTLDVAGVMGFSQGALMASLLAVISQNNDSRWPNLQVAILLCGAYHKDATEMLPGSRLCIPSIHLHGLQDPHLESSRMLYSELYDPSTAVIIEADMGHSLPHDKRVAGQIAAHVRSAARVARRLSSFQLGILPDVPKVRL